MLYKNNYKLILNEMEQALKHVEESEVEHLVTDILSAEKVFVVGVGRVLMSLQAMAKRLAHLGIDAHVVGDITEPAITEKDLLIVGSGSGSSLFPVAIARKAKEFHAKVVHIGSNPQGTMAEMADYMVRIPVRTKLYLEDEISSQQPMTSLFEQALYVLGDSIAMMIMEEKKIDDIGRLWEYHANLE